MAKTKRKKNPLTSLTFKQLKSLLRKKMTKTRELRAKRKALEARIARLDLKIAKHEGSKRD